MQTRRDLLRKFGLASLAAFVPWGLLQTRKTTRVPVGKHSGCEVTVTFTTESGKRHRYTLPHMYGDILMEADQRETTPPGSTVRTYESTGNLTATVTMRGEYAAGETTREVLD